jgi:hypothetical protein
MAGCPGLRNQRAIAPVKPFELFGQTLAGCRRLPSVVSTVGKTRIWLSPSINYIRLRSVEQKRRPRFGTDALQLSIAERGIEK